MSTEVAGNTTSPLLPELFKGQVYKRNQGRLVRQMTCLAFWVIVALGCKSLYDSLTGFFSEESAMLELVIPGVACLLGFWISFRLVNWPRFADFLIAVEAEMNKVSWPSKAELIRASIVVIFTIFFLAMSLFTFDIVWRAIFEFIGVAA